MTSISPSSGTTEGGTSVTITGTNFTGATAVTIGGVLFPGFTVVNDTTITATTGAHAAGVVDVVVTTPGGTGTGTGLYTYVTPAPTVTNVSPNSGTTAGGTSVTITGTHFTGATAVTIGGVAATGITVVNDTNITATTGAHVAAVVDVTVTTAGGTSATNSADQFAYVLAPMVTAINPTSGTTLGGTFVTITGTNLTGATAVTIGGTAATGVTVNADMFITAITPAHAAGAVDVVVTTPGGTGTGSGLYTYVTPAPTVSFNSNGGSAVASQTVAYNATATLPTAPTKTGNTFAGWYSDIGLSSAFVFSTAITADTTLYAKWTLNNYTVSFTSNGGSAVTSQSVVYNATATLPATPTKAGSTFAGWYADAGLTSAFSFSTAITGDTPLYAKWTVGPVDGVCGSANGSISPFAPEANLCTTGTASNLTSNSGTYGWTCAGSNGGNPAACSANWQATGSGTGQGTSAVTGNGWVFAPQGNGPLETAGFIPVSGHPKSPPNLPAGFAFPQGLFDFVLITGTAGSAATITITYPSPLPTGTVYWKYGPSPNGNNCNGAACAIAHWYQFPAVISGNTVTLTITDGGLGDDDLNANSVIVDQGGPGVPAAPGAVTSIPTLGEWGVILLATLLGLFGIAGVRRQPAA